MAAKSRKIRLTQAIIKSAKPNPEKDVFLWDADVTRFGVRIKPSGVKSYLIQYRDQRRREDKHTIGRCDSMKLEDARKEARDNLAGVDKGRDPAAERKSLRESQTVGHLCDQYFAEAEAGKVFSRGKPKKASTLGIDRGRIDRHIKPLLGNKAIDELSRRDVEEFMNDVIDGKTEADIVTGPRGRARVTGGPGTAGKCVTLLSAIYTYAIRKGYLEQNPCRGVEKPADNKRERFLNPDEYKRLGAALSIAQAEGVSVVAINAIKTLALTGCRKSEVLSLKGAEIDVVGHALRLRDSKSGAQARPVGRTALDFMGELAREEKEAWLFPADRGEGHRKDITKPMVKVCAIADLENITAHTLRHSFATVAHELGYSELTIGGLLGHSSNSVTARYVHHVDAALAQAADRVSTLIGERMGTDEKVGSNITKLHA